MYAAAFLSAPAACCVAGASGGLTRGRDREASVRLLSRRRGGRWRQLQRMRSTHAWRGFRRRQDERRPAGAQRRGRVPGRRAVALQAPRRRRALPPMGAVGTAAQRRQVLLRQELMSETKFLYMVGGRVRMSQLTHRLCGSCHALQLDSTRVATVTQHGSSDPEEMWWPHRC